MLGGELHRRRVGAEHAGVGQEADAVGFGGVDHVPVLFGALPDLARRDEQQPVDTREGGFERIRLGVVGLADLHAAVGEVGGLLGAAHRRDDL